MKRLAVYCGSSDGANPLHKETAVELGKLLAKKGIALVYGGASVGLMGAVANSVLEAGGEVIGVMTNHLHKKEVTHSQLTQLIMVDSMHERKAKMMDLADGFIVLPGGIGTMEEFFEVFTWAQIGIHKKSCGVLNTDHYYDSLVNLITTMEKEQFLNGNYKKHLIVENEPEKLLEKLIENEELH